MKKLGRKLFLHNLWPHRDWKAKFTAKKSHHETVSKINVAFWYNARENMEQRKTYASLRGICRSAHLQRVFRPVYILRQTFQSKKSFYLWQSSFTTLCTTYALGSSLWGLIWRTTARHFCDKTSFKPEKVGELLEREREIHLREKIEREKEIRWWTNKKQTVNMNDFNCCSRIYTDFTVCFNITCPIKISPQKDYEEEQLSDIRN